MLSTCRRAIAVLVLFAGAVQAQPANDSWALREVIVALPTVDNTSVASATVDPTDPPYFCKLGSFDQGARNVWYSFSTGGEDRYVNLSASGYDTLLAVYRGNPAEGFVQVAGGCNDNGGAVGGSVIRGLRLEAGIEYSIVVAAFGAGTPGTQLAFQIDAARVYTVTTSADDNDGTCDLDCTLREAIAASNADPGAVLVPPGTYTLTLAPGGENLNAGGDLDLLQPCGVYGQGPGASIIDGSGADRLFHIDPTSGGARSFVLGDLTLRNGNSGPADGGGAIAAVEDDDYVHLERVRILANDSQSDGGGARLNGHAWIVDSTLDGNDALGSGGGASFASLDRRALIERSTFSANRALAGAAGGGGVHSAGSLVTIRDSTLSGNRANASGGGAWASGSGLLEFSEATLARNVADADGNGSGSGGGVSIDAASPLIARNSVFGNNVRGSGAGTADDCALSGTVTFEQTSYNLVEVRGSCGFGGTGDLFGIDPQLGALADNTGLTQTHLPLTGSPLIDSGAPSCPQQDQRGKPRPTDGDGNGEATCDRGAVEIDAQLPSLIFGNGFEN
jgi:CSLREA domain-containing protein